MSRNLNPWDVLNESGTDEAECSRKVASGKMGAGVIRSLVKYYYSYLWSISQQFRRCITAEGKTALKARHKA